MTERILVNRFALPASAVFRRMAAAIVRAAFAALMLFAVAAPAAADFSAFTERLWPDARERKVSRALFDRVFAGMTPDPKVIELSRRQPEFTQTLGDYLLRRTSEARITKGREMAAQWEQTLAAIERTYGVDRFIVLSIWGNETNFGGFMGGHHVVRALATLVYSGHRRASYFRRELLNALEILAQGHVAPENMIGSWAGAMGHTQFMPSSFKSRAVDFTGDGKRDIWTSVPDALGSAANYIRRAGWRSGETWGYEVRVPPGFNLKHSGRQSIAAWMKAGVRRVNGDFPRPADQATLWAPAGTNGPIFLLLPNFQVIKRYNNSNFYALAVGHLADRIRGGDAFVGALPTTAR